jgi:GDP-mannose 6-dehydrogenase
MKISVFGLGYVGCVSSACLADAGHEVIGVDINEFKVQTISAGDSPIIENKLDELIAKSVASGALRASSDVKGAVGETELSLVCVGTPSEENGEINMEYVHRVAESIGTAVKEKTGRHTVVFRSTMLPGSMEEQVMPRLAKASGKGPDEGLGIAYNPEFLREGSAVKDFLHPPLTLLAVTDPETEKLAREAYGFVEAPFVVCSMRGAEMVKYINNSFHALKVAFANEVGTLCRHEGIDGREVMRIFCMDDKLNISPVYLQPGFAFGGSCLPKDLKALTRRLRNAHISAPVIDSVMKSNDEHVNRATRLIEKAGSKKVGVLGLSFKAGTDDLRGSPVVTIVESLVGKGYDVSIFDSNIDLERIMGTNRQFLEEEVPYLPSILKSSIREVVDCCDTLVVGNRSDEFREVIEMMRPDQTLIDMVGLLTDRSQVKGKYIGICW